MRGRDDRRECVISHCIIGPDARIGDHCQIDGLSVVGEGVVLGANNQLSNHARLFPGVTLPDGALLF